VYGGTIPQSRLVSRTGIFLAEQGGIGFGIGSERLFGGWVGWHHWGCRLDGLGCLQHKQLHLHSRTIINANNFNTVNFNRGNFNQWQRVPRKQDLPAEVRGSMGLRPSLSARNALWGVRGLITAESRGFPPAGGLEFGGGPWSGFHWRRVDDTVIECTRGRA